MTHHGDVGPLWSLIGERARSVTWAGEIEIVFTNGAQVDHLFRVATEQNMANKLRLACKRIVIGSVGPICFFAAPSFPIQSPQWAFAVIYRVP